MSGKDRKAKEMQHIKSEIESLSKQIKDQESKQDEMNNRLKAEHDSVKLVYRRFCGENKKMRFLLLKYREQKIQSDLLINLMKGKFDFECACGRKINCLTSKTQNNESTSEQKADEKGKNMKRAEKRKRRRERKRMEKENSKVLSTNLLTPKNECEVKTECCDSTTQTDQTGEREMIQQIASRQIRNPVAGEPTGLYTSEQLDRIGQFLPNLGTLESLTNDGKWRFSLAESETDKWHEIRRRHVYCKMYSRPVLLPNKLGGIIVRFKLQGTDWFTSGNLFGIELFLPGGLHENSALRLPVELSIQVDLSLANGGMVPSEKHKFTINQFDCPAEPNKFRMCFDKTGATVPPMTFKITKFRGSFR